MGAEADRRQGPALRGPQGRPVLPALRHGAVEPRGRARATRTSSTRRSTCACRWPRTAGRSSAATSCSSGPRRRGRSSSNAAVAVDPELTYVRVKTGPPRRRSCSPRRSSSACSARACRCSTASRAPRWTACATSRRSRFMPGRESGERGHTVLLADFVTADDGTGLVHTAIAFGEDDFRLGAALRAERRQPGAAGRHLRRAHRQVRRPLRQGRRRRPHRGPRAPRPRAARGGLRALLPALLALRQPAASTTRSRPGTSRPRRCATASGRQRGGQLAPASTSSTGASATGWRATSTGRSRASATGARRCRSGATRTATSRSSAPSPSSRSSRA